MNTVTRRTLLVVLDVLRAREREDGDEPLPRPASCALGEVPLPAPGFLVDGHLADYGANGARTRDLRHAMAALSQLSYGPLPAPSVAANSYCSAHRTPSFWLFSGAESRS